MAAAADDSAAEPRGCVRLDRWLWAVRVFKTRDLAAEAIRAGAVEVAGRATKPAREVRADELVTVRQGPVTRTLRVVAAPRSRVGAALVAEYAAELTPPEEFEKARAARAQQLLARERGGGRPTKRDRRRLERLWE